MLSSRMNTGDAYLLHFYCQVSNRKSGIRAILRSVGQTPRAQTPGRMACYAGFELLRKAEVWFCVEIGSGQVSSQQVGVRGSGDHGGVVGGERATWEENIDAGRGGFGSEAIPQFGVGGDAP